MSKKEAEVISISLDTFFDIKSSASPPQFSFDCVALSAKINQDFLEISLNFILLFLVVIGSYYHLKDMGYEICFNAKCFQHFIEFIPIIILTLPLLVVIYLNRNLVNFKLVFESPYNELPKATPNGILVSKWSSNVINSILENLKIGTFKCKSANFSLTSPNELYIATRLLHPRFNRPDITYSDRNKILEWLNQYEQEGLKINILRAVLFICLCNANYLTKLFLSFQFHRPQILAYSILLVFSTWISHFENYALGASTKESLLCIGFFWWGSSILLYKCQIDRIRIWFEKSREHILSIHLPLFLWIPEKQVWQELSPNELHKPFIGDYGLKVENLSALIQSILLYIYTTLL